MSERNSAVRSRHDLGLAAWFGGSLAGAVADVPDHARWLGVANAGRAVGPAKTQARLRTKFEVSPHRQEIRS
jgi:hypothetical protein